MLKILKIAVLGSTRGSDLEAIIKAINHKELKDVEISFVLSNKESAYILERAKKHGLKTIFLAPKGRSREDYDKEIDKLLEQHNINLVILIGYMKLMSNEFVDKWKNKVMNIHPSLLPMFAGSMDKNVHRAVLEYGCKISGCSLIFIDQGADTGPIILQKAVCVDENETVDTLKEKVQKAEQEILIKGIELFRDEKLEVKGRRVYISNKI